MAENPPLSLRPNYSQTRPETDICRTGLYLTDFVINEPGVKLRAAGKVSKATMVSLLERLHRPTGQNQRYTSKFSRIRTFAGRDIR
jgi:hypothetical protein